MKESTQSLVGSRQSEKFYDENGFEYYPGWKTNCLRCWEQIDNIYDSSIPFCPKCELELAAERLKMEPVKKIVIEQLRLFV